MRHVTAILRPAAGLVLGLTVAACALLSGGEASRSPAKANPSAVEIVSAGLLASKSGESELGVTLANASDKTLWVNVHFETPGGASDCVLAKEIGPGDSRLYLCAQPEVRADTPYPVKITAFINLDQTQEAGRLATELRFEQADIVTLENLTRRR